MFRTTAAVLLTLEAYMNMIKLNGTVLTALTIVLTIWMSACKHDVPQPVITDNNGNGGGSTVPCDSDTVYFNSQVLPFLVANCGQSGCHDAASHEDGVIMTSYQDIINSGIVEPGDPNDGDLIEVLTTNDPDDMMPPPPAAPLSNQQIQLIQTWIAQGAQNLDCSGICDTSNVTWSNTIRPIIQNKCQGCH